MFAGADAAPTLAQRIAAAHLSVLLKEVWWVVPGSQSVHIIAVSLVFVSGLLISLRLLGIGASTRSVPALVRLHSRLIYGGLIVLLVSGSLQTIAEPEREFHSPAYWTKMALIVIALLLTAALARSVRTQPQRWDDVEQRPGWARTHAAMFLTAWLAIIVCGRFIAYT